MENLKNMKLPAPHRTPDDEYHWTEWDACREWFTIAVTENDNVALIDNKDPDTAVFLAPEEAEEIAYALLAAARESNERFEQEMAEKAEESK